MLADICFQFFFSAICITEAAVPLASTPQNEIILIWKPGGRDDVKCKASQRSIVSQRLKTAINDLRALQNLLVSDELDPHVLRDFRDALNRVRNVAWAAQQSVAARDLGEGSRGVVSLLAAERVRATYQLCRAIQGDLSSDEIQFQKGQLAELHGVAAALTNQLKNRL